VVSTPLCNAGRTPKVTVRLGRFLRRETEYDVTCPNPNCGEDFILRKVAYVEKGVDLYLAVDMIRFAYENLYDVGVLISADGDFAKAIEVSRMLGKRIENVAFRIQKSYHLMKVLDSYLFLEDIMASEAFLY